jgi:hypothetical protein
VLLKARHHIGDLTHLADVIARRNQLHFVDADVGEFAQQGLLFVGASGKPGGGSHRIDVLAGKPVHAVK